MFAGSKWRIRWERALAAGLAGIFVLLSAGPVRAQSSEEFDEYKVRISGAYLYSWPSGSVRGSADRVPVDFHRDLGFNSYSTGGAKIDWKFTHKNHIYVVFNPFYSSKTTVLNRTITFEGQTFEVDTAVNSYVHSYFVAPGYQYDILRRRRGHLGLAVQADLFNTTAKITAVGVVSGGATGSGVVSANGSLLAPIPVAGPEFRVYLTNSPRVFLEGNVYGMYFFGYGNFVSSAGALGFTINRHISLGAGYSLASRLNVNGTSDRLAFDLTQQGPLANVEFSF